jgi:MYXO-CTERM domain-containing protein
MQRIVMIALAAALAASPAAAQDNNMTANADMAATNTVDANAALPATVDANGMVVAPDANMAMAPAPVEETAAPAPARTPARQGFPWGAIGLVGLVGLLGRRRSRD